MALRHFHHAFPRPAVHYRNYGCKYPATTSLKIMDDPSNSSGAPTTVSTSTSTSSVSSAPTEDMDLDSASSLPCYERPSFYCVFVLLPCDYRTDDENEWNRHCIGHIRDRHPPDELDCFLCDEFSARSVDKTTAWSLLMDHVVTRHGSRRNVTRTAPPRSIMRLVIQQHSISGTDKRESIYHQNLTKPECRKPHNLMQTSGISQIQEEYTLDPELSNNAVALSNCAEAGPLAECISSSGSDYDSDEEDTEEEEDGDENEDDDDDSSSGTGRNSQIVTSLMQSELRPALDAYWYRMSEGALNSLNWVLPTTPTSVRSCTGTESSGGSSGGSQRRGNNEVPAQNGSASESRPKGTERDRGKARGGGDEEGNERKKRAPANRVLRSGGRYFACPFFQRDPEKYSQCRSCPGPGWKTVHRLKEHIYRRHYRPVQCERCWKILENDEELSKHTRAQEFCELKPAQPEAIADGIDKAQEKLLRSKKPSPAIKTEIDRWNKVYKILFPDDEDIPLPWYPTSPVARRNSPGSADFANFEEYQRNALYQRMEHVVESLEETLRSELLARLRDAIAEIPQEYQRQRQRHAVTSNPVAIQDNNETNTDTTSEHSALGVVESPSIEHPVDAMFRLPPPPVNFVSEGDYQTTGLQQANANNANLQAFGSSQNSVSNPFSATSHNGRAPESSRTSLSHSQHQTQQHHNWIRPIANAELPNEGVQNQSHIGASNQPDQRLPNLLNFSFNNASHSQLDTTRSYLQAQSTGAFLPPSYGPDDSQFQPRFYFNDQNPAITNLPNTESSGWEFQPGQFTESSFPQNEVYDPLLYLSGDGNLHSPQFAEGYFNNNSNAELEPEPPQSKKRRR